MVSFWKSIQDNKLKMVITVSSHFYAEIEKCTFIMQLNKPFLFFREVERTRHTKLLPHHKAILFLLGNNALPQSQELILKKLKFMLQGYAGCTATTECLILPPIHVK